AARARARSQPFQGAGRVGANFARDRAEKGCPPGLPSAAERASLLAGRRGGNRRARARGRRPGNLSAASRIGTRGSAGRLRAGGYCAAAALGFALGAGLGVGFAAGATAVGSAPCQHAVATALQVCSSTTIRLRNSSQVTSFLPTV